LRVVLDTNIYVSALLAYDSLPARVYREIRANNTIVASWELFAELAEVMARDKFRKYFSEEQMKSFLKVLYKRAELVYITEKVNICRDKKDNIILETAVNGDAELIITGDRDLLDIGKFRGITIIKPSELEKYLE
jgi:putative PIN family toxin of toxin-antitoxin system